MMINMKTIEEINKIALYHPNEWQQGYGIWQSGFIEGEKIGAEERRKIDMDKALEYLEVALQCGVHPCNKESFIMGFKKVMEEEA